MCINLLFDKVKKREQEGGAGMGEGGRERIGHGLVLR